MRRMLLAGVAFSLVLGENAFAADWQPPKVLKAAPMMIPTFTWTGFYFGLNGGGGWGHTSHTASVSIMGVGLVPPLTTGDFNTSGGLFGGTAGYNYQIGQLVLGVENDLDWSNIKGTFGNAININGNGNGLGASFALSSQLNWLDTARARVGVAYDRAMFYGTAGAALGGVTASATASAAGGGVGVSITAADTQPRFGWTAGAGAEYAFTDNLSAKVEYLYVDLGSQNQLIIDSVKFTTSTIRGGLNWKIN